ncbi:hypothetical protein DSO57_1011899 [Entomophthora muscae]|uniref:Uncharacterized protein n=1 Tax=Entomophthora muscae TaxID=34485 RepID=A0ACC2TTP3_9FUNG|nr:hypothetical protein DSO57_1011899 [Entomophthora muscae]
MASFKMAFLRWCIAPVMRSLTCNDLEFPVLEPALSNGPRAAPYNAPFFQGPNCPGPRRRFGHQDSAPKCAPWLLSGMIMMVLDSYSPHLSAVSSLWTPL